MRPGHRLLGERVSSSFTLTSEDDQPGLGLVNWTNNWAIFPGLFPTFISLTEGNFDTVIQELELLEN